jgi:hypothetical protein
MEVGLIIQGNRLCDFLELTSCSCVLHTQRWSVLPCAAKQSPIVSQHAFHAPLASVVGEGKMKGTFFLPQVSPTSILQNSTWTPQKGDFLSQALSIQSPP